MKVNKTTLYSFLLIITILLQLYVVSYKVSILLQFSILCIFLTQEKIIVHKSFLKLISVLCALLMVGFIGTLLNSYFLKDILKDIIFIAKPIISIVLSYLIASKIYSLEKFIRTIIYLGLICAIIHLSIVIGFTKMTSIHSVRDYTKDNFVELFSLFFLIAYPKMFKTNSTRKRWCNILIISIISFSCIIYFSRMMFIIFGILMLCYLGYTRLNKRNFYIWTSIILLILGSYSILYSVNIKRDGNGFEQFLYKVKISPQEVFKSKIDPNNKKELWDHWRGYEAIRALALMKNNNESYLIGNGHGSLINLKIYAPLTGDKKGIKFISHTHNGYIFIFYKLGIIGIFIYLLFLGKLYSMGQDKHNFIGNTISSISIIYLFSTLTITGIYNTGENISLILGGLLFFYYNIQTQKNN